MTDLENCMESLIKIFHCYADEDKDKTTLSKKELTKLIEKELPTFLKTQKNPKVVDEIKKDLDQNGDDKVDFQEFLSLVTGLSIACEKCFMLLEQKKGKKCC
ncbi:protein S100-A1-like [Anoplopoma fimbria]|uniref:S100-A11 n=1 Tax=Anoplopoma fimbria TaxID=229290 RepID=C3KHI4_ANOFI|nr:protein S100-A1-like [Anoplopoma fimbria]ACQ58106.1 S100-A11 [Anoplopoma fimbria]